MSEPSTRILKSSLHRSVRLEQAFDGSHAVVKRFASRSLAGRTLDRARAAREHRLLAQLYELGLNVPRPLALERVGDGWEVRMQWIGESIAPAEILAGSATWPSTAEHAASSLGRLLAALHSAGVDHPDLHPGNALLTRDGRAWAIDFHKARHVRSLGVRRLLRDLVRLAAGAREFTTVSFRLRFLVAWWRALAPELRPELELGSLAAQIERDARHKRVQHVHKRRARWMREGTACFAVDGEFTGFAARAVELEGALAWNRAALARPGTPACTMFDESTLLITGLSERAVRRVWLCAARANEHGLHAAAPLAVSFEPRPWVALRMSSGARAGLEAESMRERRVLRSIGRMCAALADRALKPDAALGALFWIANDGEVMLGPLFDLHHEKNAAGGVDTVRALALAGLSVADLSRTERAAFALGILEGAAVTPLARKRLRVELRHG